jgi:alpha-ribazole phosphatase
MSLWLVRHATPEIAQGTCYGSTDMPADTAATRTAADTLAELLPHGIALKTSPLKRCTQLASALCEARPDLVSESDPRLAEMDFGQWEGQRWDAIDANQLAQWTDNFWLHRPGGGESVQAFMTRVGSVWDEASQTGKDCVWITHAGVMRAATLISRGMLGVLAAGDWPADAPAFGGWRKLEFQLQF